MATNRNGEKGSKSNHGDSTGDNSKKGTEKMTVTTISPTTDVFQIPVGLIVADPKKNTRSHLGDIGQLARTIKAEGLRNPVQVAKRPDGKYDLIAGYRRYAAVAGKKDAGGLEQETIRALVVTVGNETERLMANLVENFAREDLTSYDATIGLVKLADLQKFDLHDKGVNVKLANQVGKSSEYVANLTRVYKHLSAIGSTGSEILNRWKLECSMTNDEWKERHKEGKVPTAKKMLTTDNLNKLVKTDWTETETRNAWLAIQGVTPKVEKDSRSADAVRAVTQKRASKADLEKAMEALEGKMKEEKIDGDRAGGMMAALKFALGINVTIPGVYVPSVKDEDDGEDEE